MNVQIVDTYIGYITIYTIIFNTYVLYSSYDDY